MKNLYFFFAGILLFFPSVNFGQTEYKDVAPIFFSRCASCHRENGGAPFSLTSYSEAKNNIFSVEYAISNNIMPPWPPDTAYTRFMHERIITAEEKSTILDWINAGAPAGDTTQAPAPPVFPVYRLFGTPDTVLRIPVFTSKASSTDTYVCFTIPTGLTTDRMLRAFEIIPGNHHIVHHVVVMVDTTNSTATDTSGNCYNLSGDFGIGGYAPGSAPTVLPGQAPLKAGIRMPAGAKLMMQMHYPAGTAGEVDSTQIRMYYYPEADTGIRKVFVETALQNWNLFIPANSTQTYSAQITVPSPVSILAASPHSHKICTKIVNYAYDNSGDTIPLIRINNWNFEWQGAYSFKNPVKVPAGYKLFSSHFYDNTTNNPHNPSNPPQWVNAGLNTTDEMLFDGFQWLDYQPGDENIDIGAILASDTLLHPVSVMDKPKASEKDPLVYPNPSSGSFTIRMPKTTAAAFVSIYNILGERIYSAALTAAETTLRLNGMEEGIYFYSIAQKDAAYSGKIIIARP